MSTEQQTTTSTATATNTTRLYVGFFSVNVDKDKLVNLFSQYGTVKKVKVLKRKQSKQEKYAFIEFTTEEEATKALEGNDKLQVEEGATVKIELAKELPVSTKKPRQPKVPKTTNTSTTNNITPDSSTTNNNNTTTTTPSTTTSNRRRRNNKSATTEPKTTDTTTTPTKNEPTTLNNNTTENNNDTTSTTKKRTTTKPKVSNEDKPLSPTTLVIYNLPYSYDDAKLLELFKEHNPKESRIITNKRNKRSFGYGFVEFESPEAQQVALTKLNGLDVGGRNISVKVAHLIQQKPEIAPQQEQA